MTQSSHLPHFRTWLNSLSEEELATILRHRPDVLTPLPPSIAALATRLLLRTSIAQALAECNAQQLAVLEDIAKRGGELAEVEDHNPAITRELKDRGLAFGAVQIPPEVMPALPTGWSLLNQLEVSPATIDALAEDERHVLATLARSNGIGTTRETNPSHPVPRLIAKQLLQRVDSQTVRLPREVHRAMKGHTVPHIPTEPSARRGEPTADRKADDAGTAAGLSVVRGMQQLISALGARPIELLKDKTVGVRPLAQLSKQLDIAELELRRLITLGLSARLINRGEPSGYEGNFLAPTDSAQEWLDAGLAAQWRVLLAAWEHSPWTPWESGRVLAASTDRLPKFRRHILDVYLHSAEPLSAAEFQADLHFSFPLFATHTSPETIEELHREAEWIGAIALGRATSVLIDGFDAADSLTPDTIDYFLVQADMTVLVPGPLEPAAHHTLESLADLESPGLASVYRISDASLRRGLDRGMTGTEIRDFFAAHGDVPHTLAFHIEDIAKRHGTLRSGPALSYLRSEDPALLQIAAKAAPLRLLAPTVAISQLRVSELLERLRENGLSPAAEDENGASLSIAPEPATLPTPSPRAQAAPPDIARALRNLTTGEAPSLPNLDLVHAAARTARPITIGYADKNGNTKTRTVTPLTVAGGQIDARAADGSTIRFPLHRITSVTLDA
ncbi:helicase-associated domain-containing protein [Corynebacterium accolens]|uniref:helicase-associated domain-containing protein n=1 Tax=Corynebacterium accolens TaxID=38284 RepID=UPI00254315C2|nr:helicase-associated domain-containing protein [Corynebacterium accolens]MDK4233649.1 helicase-associated domain-containing protein [Corynebacterium accolens]